MCSIPLRITCRLFHGTSSNLKKLHVEGLAQRVNLKGQNVLVRVDLNAPLAKDDVSITDDTRLRAIVPTAKFLLDKGANVILCSHFGRPKGVVVETGKNGRLNPVVPYLQDLLGVPVMKTNHCIGVEVERAANGLKEGEVMLLENTRFHDGETKNDSVFASNLGKLANYFVMDAFGTAHRAHASTAGVMKHMKFNAAGFLMEKELEYLCARVLENPRRPMMAILGGSKVSTKIPVIESLLDRCDIVLLGGGMIFTFFKALGHNVGSSIVEEDMLDLASGLLRKAEEKGTQLILPTDVVLADKFDNDASTVVTKFNEISCDWKGLDIGPQTIELFAREIDKANTIVFNGPMGVFELPSFATGTIEIAKKLAHATETRNAITIVGGGDSVAAVNLAGLGQSMSHISTGGGASLELLEGKELPGVAALTEVD